MEQKCKVCQKEFLGRWNQEYCGIDCRDESRAMRRAKWGGRKRPSPTVTVLCGQCSQTFLARDARSKFCLECKAIRDKAYKRNNALKSNFGIDADDWKMMFSLQGNACAICKRPGGGKAYMAVDHDHQTNRIRGILCRDCNMGLGNFKDSQEFLEIAARYLLAGVNVLQFN